MTDWRGCAAGWRVWLATGDAAPLVGDGSPAAFEALADGAGGDEITRSRSSWVHRIRRDAIDCHVKTYAYPAARDRLRGWFRNTLFAPSRALREAEAAGWLRAHGFAAPRPLLVAERRAFGGLRLAVVATETLAGERLDHRLAALDPSRQVATLRALAAWVAALHDAGFRDRNLDLRNILLLPGDRPHFAKLDSPRFVAAGTEGPDALTRADWARLSASLATLGLAWPDSAPSPGRSA